MAELDNTHDAAAQRRRKAALAKVCDGLTRIHAAEARGFPVGDTVNIAIAVRDISRSIAPAFPDGLGGVFKGSTASVLIQLWSSLASILTGPASLSAAHAGQVDGDAPAADGTDLLMNASELIRSVLATDAKMLAIPALQPLGVTCLRAINAAAHTHAPSAGESTARSGGSTSGGTPGAVLVELLSTIGCLSGCLGLDSAAVAAPTQFVASKQPRAGRADLKIASPRQSRSGVAAALPLTSGGGRAAHRGSTNSSVYLSLSQSGHAAITDRDTRNNYTAVEQPSASVTPRKGASESAYALPLPAIPAVHSHGNSGTGPRTARRAGDPDDSYSEQHAAGRGAVLNAVMPPSSHGGHLGSTRQPVYVAAANGSSSRRGSGSRTRPAFKPLVHVAHDTSPSHHAAAEALEQELSGHHRRRSSLSRSPAPPHGAGLGMPVSQPGRISDPVISAVMSPSGRKGERLHLGSAQGSAAVAVAGGSATGTGYFVKETKTSKTTDVKTIRSAMYQAARGLLVSAGASASDADAAVRLHAAGLVDWSSHVAYQIARVLERTGMTDTSAAAGFTETSEPRSIRDQKKWMQVGVNHDFRSASEMVHAKEAQRGHDQVNADDGLRSRGHWQHQQHDDDGSTAYSDDAEFQGRAQQQHGQPGGSSDADDDYRYDNDQGATPPQPLSIAPSPKAQQLAHSAARSVPVLRPASSWRSTSSNRTAGLADDDSETQKQLFLRGDSRRMVSHQSSFGRGNITPLKPSVSTTSPVGGTLTFEVQNGGDNERDADIAAAEVTGKAAARAMIIAAPDEATADAAASTLASAYPGRAVEWFPLRVPSSSQAAVASDAHGTAAAGSTAVAPTQQRPQLDFVQESSPKSIDDDGGYAPPPAASKVDDQQLVDTIDHADRSLHQQQPIAAGADNRVSRYLAESRASSHGDSPEDEVMIAAMQALADGHTAAPTAAAPAEPLVSPTTAAADALSTAAEAEAVAELQAEAGEQLQPAVPPVHDAVDPDPAAAMSTSNEAEAKAELHAPTVASVEATNFHPQQPVHRSTSSASSSAASSAQSSSASSVALSDLESAAGSARPSRSHVDVAGGQFGDEPAAVPVPPFGAELQQQALLNEPPLKAATQGADADAQNDEFDVA